MKISHLILNIFLLFTIAGNCFAYTPLTRVRNFVNDAANSIPITASYMDAELNQILTALNGTWVVQATAPSSPFEGMSWYNTTNHILEQYRNNEWVTIGTLHISSTVMANPQQGDIWYNTSTNVLQTYNGSSWLTILTNVNPLYLTPNVGIGTTLPANQLTVIGGVGIGTTGAISTTTVAPAGGMLVGGNVGIGTVTPGTILDVNGTTRSTAYKINGGTNLLGTLVTGSSCTGSGSPLGPANTDLFYEVSITGGTSTLLSVYSDSSNPPTSLICQESIAAGGSESCFTIVQKGNYYYCSRSGSGTIATYVIPLGAVS